MDKEQQMKLTENLEKDIERLIKDQDTAPVMAALFMVMSRIRKSYDSKPTFDERFNNCAQMLKQGGFFNE